MQHKRDAIKTIREISGGQLKTDELLLRVAKIQAQWNEALMA